jgi:hypothetical protein
LSQLLQRLNSEVFNEGVLDKLAKTSGAIKRVRKITGSQLADLLMFDAGESLNGMSMQLTLRHGLSISKQALHQKFNKDMVSFMKQIFETLIAVELPDQEIQGLDITIKDATRFALPDCMVEELPGLAGSGMKAGAAVQFEFGLKSGKASIGLTAARVNDQSESRRDQQEVRSGELYLRDLGYAHIGYMNNIDKQSAFFVNKLNPQTLVYTQCNGFYELLDLDLIRGITDMQVYIGKEKLPVRLIIEPVDEVVKASRIERVNKYNKKKGLTTSDRFKQRAGFNFIISNLDKDVYETLLLQKLYHLRWQVELVFKAWKSLMKLHVMGTGCVHRIWCKLYGKLIWVMLGWKITMSVGKVGQISLLKMYGMIASTREALRQQVWKINDNWIELVSRVPITKLLKEQRKGRLKIEEIILSI